MSLDEQIGRNLQAMRGEISQQALADAMRERGFKWSQATVWSIEKGERPLRVAEAEEVAHILGRNVFEFTRTDQESAILAQQRRAHDAYEAIKQATREFMDARLHLEFEIDRAKESGEDIRGGGVLDGGGWLEAGPVEAAKMAMYVWEHEEDVTDAALDFAHGRVEDESGQADG